MPAKVISVEARKGGVGKTTLASHLAVGIARAVYPDVVLYIHIDPQGDASRALGVERNGRCISQLLLEEKVPGDVIMPANLEPMGGPPRPNLFYLPSSDRLSEAIEKIQDDVGAMRELARRMSDGMRQRQGLQGIEDLTDIFVNTIMPFKKAPKGPRYIIIDCPPSLGALQLGVHKIADWAVVPVRLGDLDVSMTVRHTNQIAEDLGRSANMKLMTVVPNMVRSNLKAHQELLRQLKEAYGRRRLLFEPLPLRTSIDQAQSAGLTIWDHEGSWNYESSNDVSRVLHDLVRKVIAV